MSSSRDQALEEKYNETISFLYSLERFGILLGLDNITSLLEQLGNPQKSFPVVHVAGSNGKGSTSAFIFGALREAGYKTALYTSPHLNDFRERIKVNGSLVPKEAIVESVEKIRRIYDPERTTFFEFTTAVAFDFMARANPDIAVIEVGLGGRLDATNTVDPLVTLITDISREHEDYLGTGIAAVAGEKAGIIKPGIPLITGAGRSEARRVILETARKASAAVREFGRQFSAKKTGANVFNYRSDKLALADVSLTMPGSHQMKNAALAIAVVEELRDQGYKISETAIRAGIQNTVFPGRFEILRRQPDVIIDGAHTPEGMRLLKSAFKRLYPGTKSLLLLGMLQDKNYEALLDIIAPIAREVVCVPPQGTRALDPEKLALLVRKKGIPSNWASDITEGFEMLLKKAKEHDVVLAAGSLYMIGQVRRACGIGDDETV
jgi:dihydrofolate synthase / folylpolyglutamate synthase